MVLSEGMVVLREVIYGLFEAVRDGLADVMVQHGENKGSRKGQVRPNYYNSNMLKGLELPDKLLFPVLFIDVVFTVNYER